MDELSKKNAIIKAMTEMECYPLIQNDVAIQEYSKVPIGQISAMGATFSSVAESFKNIFKSVTGAGENLYRMHIEGG